MAEGNVFYRGDDNFGRGAFDEMRKQKSKLLGKIVKVRWDDACDSCGDRSTVMGKGLIDSWTIGEVLGDWPDRINLRHQCSKEVGDNEDPHEGTVIPKGCIKKIEVYKLGEDI